MIYEHQNLSLSLVSFLVGLSNYEHPCPILPDMRKSTNLIEYVTFLGFARFSF